MTGAASGPLSKLIVNKTSPSNCKRIYNLFPIADHSNGTLFNFLERLECFEFSWALYEAWNVPSMDKSGGTMLDDTYETSMNDVFNEIGRKGGGTVDVAKVTNKLSKAVSNVSLHLPYFFFI